MRVINKFGLVFIKNNKILLCEPFAFKDLILPGGIKEGNESFFDNFTREVREELGNGAKIQKSSLSYLGNFSDIAAGRKDVIVTIDLYKGEIFGDLVASSEIKNLVWFSPHDDFNILSPILKNKIIPYLITIKELM